MPLGSTEDRADAFGGELAREQGFREKHGPAVIAGVRELSLTAPEPGRLLMDAKFTTPRPHLGAVSRADLVRAARLSDCRVVTVTAPAGYGKSAFLAEWAAAEDRHVAWAALDHFDDDPAILLASLALAYCRAGLGDADLVAGMAGHGRPALGSAAPRLAAEIRATPVPFVLMLDNLHELRSPACHDVLGMVISSIPRGSHLATASRSQQPYLPRLRACGAALEVEADDLAMDAIGARQVFADARVSLSPEQAVAVAKRTEGWPAGLYLSALITRRAGGKEPAVTGDDRYVADYLYREVLIQQPEDMRRFLRRTAVLDELSAPLCDGILGACDSAGRLYHLEAASLFLIPLDRRRQWYRYHALFREFLLSELRGAEPGIVMTLHRRAADWHEANGSPALALEHLLQTTDWDRCARLAAALAAPTYKAGQISTLERWLRVIGDAHIERFPPLAVHRCWVAALTGDTAGTQRWAAVVDGSSFDGAPLDGTASFESGRAMLRSVMCARGPDQMAADAALAVAEEPAWSPWRGTALWTLGAARLLAGQFDEARAALAEASLAATATGSIGTVVACESELALLAMDRGWWEEAAARLERALALIDEDLVHGYVPCLLAFAQAARLAVHLGDLTEARRQLAQAMRSCSRATYALPWVAVRLRLQLAKVHFSIAEVATARQLLREIDDTLSQRPGLGALTEQVGEFRRVLASSTAEMTGQATLTPAELRLLPYLRTHLTASGIAERLFVSSHTVKAEVKSIYRKLGVSSRNEAVQKATAIGLLSA